jgi:lipid A 3-O-deacylase
MQAKTISGAAAAGLAGVVTAGIVAAGIGCVGSASAAPPQDPQGIYTFQVENDAASTFKGTSDQYYTSGLRLGYTSGTIQLPGFLADIGRTVWGDGVQRISIDISQSLFTPRNTQSAQPILGDRPYAGWLHADLGLIHDTDDARSYIGASLGVVGPSALGKEVQNGFHNVIGDTPNLGWRNQIKDEPAVELYAEQTYRIPLYHFNAAGLNGIETDVLPSATLGVGTVRDYLQGGFVLRLGQGLDSDFGAARIRPGITGTDAYTATRPFAWYVFAGADGQAIARDVFLDGATFRDNQGPHVTKRPLVGEFEGGLAVMAYGVRLTYTQTWQTEEFRRQKAGLFNFGSLALSAKF